MTDIAKSLITFRYLTSDKREMVVHRHLLILLPLNLMFKIGLFNENLVLMFAVVG